MFEKNMKLAYLIDFYIDLLDPHSANIIKAYYDDDLSLAEIAAGEGISRQGIRHIIKKSEEQILFFEETLGLAKRYSALEDAAQRLKALKELFEEQNLQSASAEIDSIVDIILNKGV
ncbi:MAG: DNA-binding protein [Clostridia bacterium]|nr:DNA-binding protein [Clostridia bacterium]